jgi:hypothetical protein
MRATLPLGMAALLAGVFWGCGEVPIAAPLPVVPAVPTAAIATLRGTVDLDHGTLEFEPVQPAGLPGFSAAIYGDQNVNVRVYNSPVVLDSSTSTWRWTANVGIRNLRPHFIGDEETTAVPLDTMGLYVFFVQEPVLGQPCGGCFVRIANHDGSMSFDAPNRKYFYWRERLNAVGSPAGDTTRVRRAWRFETSAGVRSFSFTVLVAAAWPAPHETRWRVEYTADSLPERSAPVWKFEGTGGNVTVGSGSLTLRGRFTGMFYRRDPIAPTQDAYVDAVVRVNGAGSPPGTGMALSDRVKLMGLGIGSGTVGLLSANGTFLAGTTAPLGNGVHQFQLRKYGADSVVYFVDGVRRGGAAYGTLSSDTLTPPLSSVSFGGLPTGNGTNSTWDGVIYEIGVASP